MQLTLITFTRVICRSLFAQCFMKINCQTDNQKPQQHHPALNTFKFITLFCQLITGQRPGCARKVSPTLLTVNAKKDHAGNRCPKKKPYTLAKLTNPMRDISNINCNKTFNIFVTTVTFAIISTIKTFMCYQSTPIAQFAVSVQKNALAMCAAAVNSIMQVQACAAPITPVAAASATAR